MHDENPSAPEGDRELLQRFVRRASAPAFDELVRRHLDHVFSAALRRVNGDHALAEDVAQTVFIDFARKAPRIPEDMPPGGWLHRHTGFVASKMIDKERRRRAREQQAVAMDTTPHPAADPDWASTAPLLDAAMDSLPDSDRNAIVLRFFEQKDFRSVGEALGMSDDTAQKKVSRAIDKLRGVLGRKGIASTGGALAALLAANSVQAAPASLAGRVAAHSLAGAAAGGGTLWGALLGMGTAARLQAGAALVGLAAVAGLAGSKLAQPEEREQAPAPAAALEPAPSPPVTALGGGPADPEPRPAAAPEGVDALVAAAAAEWRGGRDGVASSARALGFLSQIGPDQMLRALEIAKALEDEPARALVTRHLLSHWAETHPREAMAWAHSGAGGPQHADLTQGVLNAWAGRDPEAVLGWNAKAAAGQRRTLSDSVVGTVFRTMAKEDPARALERLQWLRSPNERGQALLGILDTVQSNADRERIAELIATIGSDDIRVQARRAMVEQWARRDAPAAAAFVASAEPAWERTRLMDSLGYTWLQSDPAKAADWWVAQAPGPDTLVKIINVWAQQDPNAAGAWLGKQPAGASSDTARMTFARQVADLDPEGALRWAETVSDAEMREGTIDHVYANWHTRAAGEARAFLLRAGWPQERVARLQTTTPPKGTAP